MDDLTQEIDQHGAGSLYPISSYVYSSCIIVLPDRDPIQTFTTIGHCRQTRQATITSIFRLKHFLPGKPQRATLLNQSIKVKESSNEQVSRTNSIFIDSSVSYTCGSNHVIFAPALIHHEAQLAHQSCQIERSQKIHSKLHLCQDGSAARVIIPDDDNEEAQKGRTTSARVGSGYLCARTAV